MAHDDPFDEGRPQSGAADPLEPFAAQVISILCDRQIKTPSGARQAILDRLVKMVTSRTAFDPVLVMEELRGRRLTIDNIIDLYIPEVATALGSLWTLSEIDFASVTVGALRLQALLDEASSQNIPLPQLKYDVPLALIVVPEGEQHFLGASVVGAQLKRLGCDVGMSIAEPEEQIVNRVLHDMPDMVLMSSARTATLETIARTAKTIKAEVAPTPVLALGGAFDGDINRIKEVTGVDLVTKSPKDVIRLYMKRRKVLGQK